MKDEKGTQDEGEAVDFTRSRSDTFIFGGSKSLLDASETRRGDVYR